MTGRLHVRNGKYVIIINTIDEKTGKYKPKWIATDLPEKGNKRNAEKLLNETLANYKNIVQEQTKAKAEQQAGASTMTMPELVREWLETVKGTVRGNSYNNYVTTSDIHVIPYFEALGLSVQEIKPVHVQKYYNLKHSEGLSASTIEKHRSVIRGAFMYARDILEIIETIPSDRAKLPKKETTPPTYYTEKELEKLFKVVDGETVESAVRLCATYGFRRSEVLGLKWNAVDFDRKTITVLCSMIREGSKVVEKETVKKQASYRTMPLIPVMERYLKELQAQQKKDKKLCGKSYQDSDFICRREDGSLLEPNNVTFRFRTIIKQAIADNRLNKYIRFHDLRHSAASTLVNNGCTLKQVQAWLKQLDLRANTYAAYEDTATIHVLPYFEALGVTVADVSPAHIQRYYLEKSNKGLGAGTLTRHRTIIRSSLDYAIQTLGILKANPADRVKLSKAQKRLPSFYTVEQLKRLFKAVDGESIEAPVKLSAYLGLRRSEALALRWSSIDWTRKTVSITHTLVRVRTKTEFKDTVKQIASYRTMPLLPDLESFLRKLQAHQKQLRKVCGKDFNTDDFICIWDDGRLLEPDYVTGRFNRFLKEKELPHIRFHDLRHSSASLLINNGCTLKEVQEWLGQASSKSTEIYAHMLHESKNGMAEKINNALSLEIA